MISGSHSALQVSPLIGATDYLNSVPGSFDRHAQLLTGGNLEIIWHLDKTLVRVMHCNICDHTLKQYHTNWRSNNPRVDNYFEAARMIQTKIGAEKNFKHLIQVRLYFHSKKPLKNP